MIVQCPACSSRYRVNASNIPSTGGKIRCPSCQHAFVVYPDAPAPAPPKPSYDEDRTSIASRPDLQQLLHNFQQGGPASGGSEDAGATEIMSGDSLPDFSKMFGQGGASAPDASGDDGTVEMQNPLAFIKQWEGEHGASHDEEDATQIASPDFDFEALRSGVPPAGMAPPARPAPSPIKPATPQPPSRPQPAAPPMGSPPAFAADPFAGMATQESPSPFANLQTPQAPPAPLVSGPDANHQGPWKLKTNFGLTYEFVDTQNLLQWMSSRDDLEGYMLSGGKDEFYPVRDFPQIAQGLAGGGRTRTSRPSNMSTGPIPAPAGLGAAPAATPGFGAAPAGFGAPQPNQGFGAPPQQPNAPRGDLIKNATYQPPSRDATWNKVLWVVFILLFVGAIGIALQLSGVVDLKTMILGAPPAQPVQPPAATSTPPPKPTPSTVVEDPAPSQGELDALLKDARRAIKNNKLISAKEVLQTARLMAPKNPEVYELLAEVYELTGEKEEATKARDKATQLKSAEPEDKPEQDKPQAPEPGQDPPGGQDPP